MFKEEFKKVISLESRKYNLNITVTSGVEQYQEDYTELYQKTDIFVVCYDITSKDSFIKAKDIISKDLLPYIFIFKKGNPNIILIGNKSDLKERISDYSVITEFTSKYNLILLESSAKNNSNISGIFNRIIELYDETISEYEKDI